MRHGSEAARGHTRRCDTNTKVAQVCETNREPSHAPESRFRTRGADTVRREAGSCYCEPVWGYDPGGVGRHQSRRKAPASQPGRARGSRRHGLSQAGGARQDDGGRAASGNKIRSRGEPPNGDRPHVMERGNLRGKRQDPWRRANGRANRAVPTLRTGAGVRNQSHPHADPVRPTRAGRHDDDQAKKPHPTSHPTGDNPRWPASLRSRNGLRVRAGRRSVGKLTAGDTSG
jgi:hypothetical protein